MKQRIFTSLVCLVLASEAWAQGTGFTYQGRLIESGAPAGGSHDFEFRLFNAVTGGVQVGGAVAVNDAGVTNGLFTVTLDFGAGAFDGSARWLEIAVRPGASAGPFASMSPRQPITATPYAVRAGSLPSGAVTSAMLADGVVTSAKLAPGAVNSLGSPDGSPLSAVSVNTNGLVGIGTNQPVAGLDVRASQSFLNPVPLAVVVDGSGGYTNLNGAIGVAVEANLLAVAAYEDSGVTLVDVSNPAGPVLRAQIRDGDGVFTNLANALSVELQANLLVVAAESDSAVTLISVTNPSSPARLAVLRDGVGGFNELDGAGAVAISGNLLAIAARRDHAVTLVDISDPVAPVIRAVLKDGTFGFNDLAGAQGLALSGNLLAIAALNDHAVTLVDVSNPANPIKRAELRDGVGGFDGLGGAVSVALSGNLLAIAGYSDSTVTLVDVSNPATPVKRAEWNSAALTSARFVSFSGAGLLAAVGQVGNAVSIFDVSSPLNPALVGVARQDVGGFGHFDGASGVAFISSGRLAAASYVSSAVTLMELMPAAAGLTSSGRVGIGTALPAGALHVVGDMVVEGAQRIELNAANIELGRNATAKGRGSIAAGDGALASGDFSTAFGRSTTASGIFSTALGYFTTASGPYATAMGFATLADFNFATAMGYETTAAGSASTAMGLRTVASGNYSTAMGVRAKAAHQGAFVWADSQNADFASTADNQFLLRAAGGVGIGTGAPATKLHVSDTESRLRLQSTAANAYAVTEHQTDARTWHSGVGGSATGPLADKYYLYDANAGQTRLVVDQTGNVGIGTSSPAAKLHVAGNLTVEGTDAAVTASRVKLGWNNTASGSSATALGLNTTANGDSVTAMGEATVATGFATTATGASTTASGTASTAMGYLTSASGYASTALGFATSVGGDYSMAMGRSSVASGSYSLAAGHRAKANHQGAFVWGDSTDADFASTAANQFSVRAQNGVVIQAAANSTALELRTGGGIKVTGAGIGTATPVFIHRATAANIQAGAAHRTTIDHPLCNGDPNAILIVTQNYNAQNSGNVAANHSVGVYYNPDLNKWQIFHQNIQPIEVNTAWNVLVVKP